MKVNLIKVKIICRIVDNMPVTWCYDVADSNEKYCATGFPIGCYVTNQKQPKDACVISVSMKPAFFLKKHDN